MITAASSKKEKTITAASPHKGKQPAASSNKGKTITAASPHKGKQPAASSNKGKTIRAASSNNLGEKNNHCIQLSQGKKIITAAISNKGK